MSELESLRKIIEFVEADLIGCLKGGVNFGLAVLLSAYTEQFGHFLKNDKCNRSNYDAWLKYMGLPYSNFIDSDELYSRIRCGLIHEYTIKKGAIIFTEHGPPGIEIINNVIHFNNLQYAEDFIISIKKYYYEVQNSEKMLEKFRDSRKDKPIVL
jgi:hypothetical protein